MSLLGGGEKSFPNLDKKFFKKASWIPILRVSPFYTRIESGSHFYKQINPKFNADGEWKH